LKFYVLKFSAGHSRNIPTTKMSNFSFIKMFMSAHARFPPALSPERIILLGIYPRFSIARPLINYTNAL